MSTSLESIFRVFGISRELDLQLFKIPRQTYKYLRSHGKLENLKSTWIKHAGMPSNTWKISQHNRQRFIAQKWHKTGRTVNIWKVNLRASRMDANGSKMGVCHGLWSSFPDVTSHEKRIARQIDANSVVQTLIDNGKLANHIARLEAIVVKFSVPNLYFPVTISHALLLS